MFSTQNQRFLGKRLKLKRETIFGPRRCSLSTYCTIRTLISVYFGSVPQQNCHAKSVKFLCLPLSDFKWSHPHLFIAIAIALAALASAFFLACHPRCHCHHHHPPHRCRHHSPLLSPVAVTVALPPSPSLSPTTLIAIPISHIAHVAAACHLCRRCRRSPSLSTSP